MSCTTRVSTLATAMLLAIAIASSATGASWDFSNFSAAPQNFNGGQYQTGFVVAHTGILPGWSHSGLNAVHAVDHANVYPDSSSPPDYALMVFYDNMLTLENSIAGSNNTGVTYDVDFLASPTVYQNSWEVTLASDGLVFDVLRDDDSVLATYTHLPGSWAGNLGLQPGHFAYTGDGSGDIRLRVSTVNGTSQRWGGAIDNLTLIPEPTTALLLTLGLAGLGMRRRHWSAS